MDVWVENASAEDDFGSEVGVVFRDAELETEGSAFEGSVFGTLEDACPAS